MALAAPERVRVSLTDDFGTWTALPLPARRTWPVAVICGIMFLIFAGVEVTTIRSMWGQRTDTVFDLMALLFQGFWVLGWSVGVLFLLLLTVFFVAFSETLRIAGPRLIQITRLGPLKIFSEYDLASVRNLRVEPTANSDLARVRFDYGGGAKTLGQEMPRVGAEECVRTVDAAVRRAERRSPDALEREAPPAGNGFDVTQWLSRRGVRVNDVPAVPASTTSAREEMLEALTERKRNVEADASVPERVRDGDAATSWTSSLVLIGANLIPLAGVLLFGWSLSEIMVLFWAENAVIGFYNLLKLGVVARWGVLFVGPFFVGHYGGFMAGHFLFVYYMFVRGLGAVGAEPSAVTGMTQIFVPLWPALLVLFISHGISFAVNFLGNREYVGRTTSQQMGEPYKRIIMLHLTLIFGGWMVMLLHSALPALVMLIGIKTAMDLAAHRSERRGATRSRGLTERAPAAA